MAGMDRPTITWFHFMPSQSGSFGNEDMGEYCRLGNALFVVPHFSAMFSNTSRADIEAKVLALTPNAPDEAVFEFSNGDFTQQTTVEWHGKIASSTRTSSTWQ